VQCSYFVVTCLLEFSVESEWKETKRTGCDSDQLRFMSTRLATLLRGYTALDDTQLQDATQPKEIAAGQSTLLTFSQLALSFSSRSPLYRSRSR